MQNGDRLWAKESSSELHLEQDDGRITSVKPANSPYTVQDTGKAPSIFANMVKWAGDWLNNQVGAGGAEPTISLSSRNPTTTDQKLRFVPAPSNTAPAHLLTGTRPFAIGWQGGIAPFHLRLLSKTDNKVLLNQPEIKHHFFSNPALELPTGAYQLSIEDAQKQQATLAIEVVTVAALPVSPSDLKPATDADSLKHTVYAVWLASQGDIWVLEAYQRAWSRQDQHQPAKWLMHSLEKGHRPSNPKLANPSANTD